MISTTNATALQILKGLETNTRTNGWKISWEGPPNRGPALLGYSDTRPILIEPISDAAKDAVAKIVAILGKQGGTVDTSAAVYTSAAVSANAS